jgi:hypothetical protein
MELVCCCYRNNWHVAGLDNQDFSNVRLSHLMVILFAEQVPVLLLLLLLLQSSKNGHQKCKPGTQLYTNQLDRAAGPRKHQAKLQTVALYKHGAAKPNQSCVQKQCKTTP